MKKRFWGCVVLAVALTACGTNDTTYQPNDDAVAMGGEAARVVSLSDHADTMALQRAIIDARAQHDEYVLTGQEGKARDFAKAFTDSLRRCDPEVANELFGTTK